MNEDSRDENHDNQMYISIQNGNVSALCQLHDYTLSCRTTAFEKLCLNEFVACTRKITKKSESTRNENWECNWKGSPLKHTWYFCLGHGQYDTHLLTFRSEECVSVIIGLEIPRRGQNEDNNEYWLRVMFILFKLWGNSSDIKEQSCTWKEA
jgi:hypothetical protein